MNLDLIFARNLELIRVARGYTQENLALDAEISRSHLANLKSGSNSSTLETLSKIAAVLEVEPWLLLVPDLVVENATADRDASLQLGAAPPILKIAKIQESKRRLRPSES